MSESTSFNSAVPPPNRVLNRRPKWPLTNLEGFEQTLPAFAIEIGDALTQALDRLLHVGALALELLQPRRQLGLFFLGPRLTPPSRSRSPGLASLASTSGSEGIAAPA